MLTRRVLLAGCVASVTAPVTAHPQQPVGRMYRIGTLSELPRLRDGLVATLARPGGNVTGVVVPLSDLAAKRVPLMKEVAPHIASLAIISNPNSPTARLQAESAEAAARALRIIPHVVGLSSKSEAEVEKVFSAIAARGARAVVVTQDAVTFQAARTIARLTAKHRLPSSYASENSPRQAG